MLALLTALTLALLVLLALSLFIWVRHFTTLLSASPAEPIADEELPRAVVLLPVRGADPSLSACLRGLLEQDYPNYEIRIIVDSLEDPAWERVHAIVDESPDANVQVFALEDRRTTCSLKMSALVQALNTLEDDCEAVVLVDGDVMPHTTWLRDLVSPLADPKVGGVSGIRWYVPSDAGWGTLVRHLWNAPASVLMNALHIPWGGSLAFRADIVRRSDVLDRWSHSLFEDTGFYEVLTELGLQLRISPAATMLNRESTDVGSCFRFIRRQMLNVRLYHPSWRLVMSHGLTMALAPLFAVVLLGIAIALGEWATAIALTAGLVLTAASMAGTLLALGRHVGKVAERRGEEVEALPLRGWLAIPLTQLVYAASLISACCLRVVDWRGISYEFRGPWEVRMVEYQPYRSAAQPADHSASLV